MRDFSNAMKLLRKKSNLSIQQLAEKAEISRSMLYKIENLETQPSLEMAVRISRALNTTLSTMLNEAEAKAEYLIRRDQLPEWKDPKSGLIRRSLLPPSASGEWLRVTLPANTQTGYLPEFHDRSGYIYLLSGKVNIKLRNGDTYNMAAGDVFIIPNHVEHCVKNAGTNKCEFFVTILPGVVL